MVSVTSANSFDVQNISNTWNLAIVLRLPAVRVVTRTFNATRRMGRGEGHYCCSDCNYVMKILDGKFGSIGSSFDLLFLLCHPTSLAVRFQACSDFGRSNGRVFFSNSFRTQTYVCFSSTLVCSFVLLEAVCTCFLHSVVFPCVTRGCMYAFPPLRCVPLCY